MRLATYLHWLAGGVAVLAIAWVVNAIREFRQELKELTEERGGNDE